MLKLMTDNSNVQRIAEAIYRHEVIARAVDVAVYGFSASDANGLRVPASEVWGGARRGKTERRPGPLDHLFE